MDRNGVFAIAATASVAVAIVLGFWNIGSPLNQRQVSADQRRSEDLQGIAQAMNHYYSGPTKLPSSLSELESNEPFLRIRDPLTDAPYEYLPLTGSQYRLCATFSTDTRNEKNPRGNYPAPLFSKHTRGRQCLDLDALRAAYAIP